MKHARRAMTAAAATPNRARFERGSLVLGALLVLVWPFVLSTFQHGDVYAVMGPFAIVVIVLLAIIGAVLRVHATRKLARDVAIGLGVGVVMTVLTYVAYALATKLVPGLARHVTDLYSASRSERLGPALAWTLVVCLAEEVLWRGWLLTLLERRVSRRVALALSLVTYAAAQSGSGSVVVLLAAVICGAIWLAERALTGSIIAGLVSHLVWTPIVVHLYPVTAFH